MIGTPVILAAIWFVWFLTGGPARYETTRGILLKPPSPLSTGETYGNLPDVKLKVPETLNIFLSGNRVVLGTRTNLKSAAPEREYIEIVGVSDTPVDITGWRLAGTKGVSAVIPKGVRLFTAGQVNQMNDIYLGKGDRAIIVSGDSPIGVSLRINACSGYLAQFQTFIPKINNICPSPLANDTLKNNPLNSSCLNYIDKMTSCTTPVSALPTNLGAACHEFILTHTTYNACVSDNKNSANFYENEWRVYLSKKEELFGSHDTIKFYDKDDNLIGTYIY